MTFQSLQCRRRCFAKGIARERCRDFIGHAAVVVAVDIVVVVVGHVLKRLIHSLKFLAAAAPSQNVLLAPFSVCGHLLRTHSLKSFNIS